MALPVRVATIAGYDDNHIFYADKAYEWFAPTRCGHAATLPDEIVHLHFINEAGVVHCFAALAEHASFYRIAGSEPWSIDATAEPGIGCRITAATGGVLPVAALASAMIFALSIFGALTTPAAFSGWAAFAALYATLALGWIPVRFSTNLIAAFMPMVALALFRQESALATYSLGLNLACATLGGLSALLLGSTWVHHARGRCDACKVVDPTAAISAWLEQHATEEEPGDGYRDGMETKDRRPE